MPKKDSKTDFDTLVAAICQVHIDLTKCAGRAVNVSLTLRNWAIGAYIAQYELRGADRARYGDTILERLAEELSDLGVNTCGKRQLYNYLKFYQVYPEIVRTAPAQFKKALPATLISDSQIVRTLSHNLSLPIKLVSSTCLTAI